MLNSLSRRIGAAAVVALLAASSAHATLFTWNYTKNQAQQFPGQYQVSNTGGTIESIAATFDDVTKRLTWDTLFTGPSGPGSSPITSGFWLVINKGPNPKNHPGELAIFYFDASSLASPKLSVYGYNGANGNNSWQDGNPAVSGNQTPDLIKGTLETGYINQIVAQNTTVNGVAMRRLKFDIDATSIINRTPLYPHATDPWHGTGFNDLIGVWMHSVDEFTAAYDSGAGKKGKITSLSTKHEGYLDGYNFIVPAPGSAALLAFGALFAARRRRA